MTQAEKKYLKQLQQKKYRNIYNEFVVEGWKSITTFIDAGWKPKKIYSVENEDLRAEKDIILITKKELKSISRLNHPKDAIAVFDIRKETSLPQNELILALDNLQDPGNMGTIIRTADWFGVKQIVCSENTVDCYNPKVVQASMGSLARVHIHYTDLNQYLRQASLPVYGTFLEGENIKNINFPKQAIIVIGNEGNGISHQVEQNIEIAVSIPKHSEAIAESLNAAVTASIFLYELRG